MLQKAEKCVVSADLKVGLMAAAIALGILAGVAGFVPLFVALRLSRKSTSTSPLSAGLYGLGGFFVSLIVVAVALIICARNGSSVRGRRDSNARGGHFDLCRVQKRAGKKAR